MRKFDLVVFDVGGVLVELGPIPLFHDWEAGEGPRDIGMLWLHSPTARAFESGRIDSATFAERMCRELGLTISPDEFIQAFAAWPKGLFPGVSEMLQNLRRQVPTAALSNSNEIHWPAGMKRWGIESLVDGYFVSYQIGFAKPDPEIYRYVIHHTRVEPQRMLYLDDNPVNVAGAAACGMVARHAVGPAGVRECLLAEGFDV